MLHITAASKFAHCGLHDPSKPRNSLAAFIAASDAGYGIELDIQLTEDKIPVVIHDSNTKSDTGVDLVIAQSTAEEVTALNFLGTRHRISTLEAVLKEMPTYVPILVDIKQTKRVKATVDAVLPLISNRLDSTGVQSFQPRVVARAKRLKGLSVGIIGEEPHPSMKTREYWQTKTLISNYFVKPDFIPMYLPMLERKITTYWKSRLNIPFLGWTVVDDEDIELCHRLGVGMIFDHVRP